MSEIEIQRERWNPGFDFDRTWYLSGPMSGYPHFNYPAFSDAVRVLRDMTGVKLLSPHENPWPDNAEALSSADLWEHMMGLCFKQMKQCQGIIMLKGWPQSTGARAEIQHAMTMNWPIWYYHDYQLTNMNKEN